MLSLLCKILAQSLLSLRRQISFCCATSPPYLSSLAYLCAERNADFIFDAAAAAQMCKFAESKLDVFLRLRSNCALTSFSLVWTKARSAACYVTFLSSYVAAPTAPVCCGGCWVHVKVHSLAAWCGKKSFFSLMCPLVTFSTGCSWTLIF